MQHNHTAPDRRICRGTRIRIMVTLGRSFTRTQVADLIGMALEIREDERDFLLRAGRTVGYWTRVTEENVPRPAAVRHGGQWFDQAVERERADSVLPEPGRGVGPVETWEVEPAVAKRTDAYLAWLTGEPKVWCS